MIEYLEKLVEDGEYHKALDYAEQLLLNPGNSNWDMMEIYTLVCRARYRTGEFYGAQVAGQLAVEMARKLEAWDHFGKAAAWLGVSYERLSQPENALVAYYDYLAHVPFYKEASEYHVMVLYNMNIVQGQIGQHEESLRTLQKAAALADALNDQRKAHGIRHAFINALLRYGKFDQVPELLAKSAYYLRHNATAPDYMQSLLWHQVLRVRFALATNRLQRAIRVARRGLRLANGWPDVSYELHLMLAQVHERLGELHLALREAVRARSIAIGARRFDLEFGAANYVYGLLNLHSDLMERASLEDWDPTAVD